MDTHSYRLWSINDVYEVKMKCVQIFIFLFLLKRMNSIILGSRMVDFPLIYYILKVAKTLSVGFFNSRVKGSLIKKGYLIVFETFIKYILIKMV